MSTKGHKNEPRCEVCPGKRCVCVCFPAHADWYSVHCQRDCSRVAQRSMVLATAEPGRFLAIWSSTLLWPNLAGLACRARPGCWTRSATRTRMQRSSCWPSAADDQAKMGKWQAKRIACSNRIFPRCIRTMKRSRYEPNVMLGQVGVGCCSR